MSKLIIYFFVLMVFNSVYSSKGSREQSEEKIDSAEYIKTDEDESASIQVVHRDAGADKKNKSLSNEVPTPDEQVIMFENFTEPLKHWNLTKAEAKYDIFFEDISNDSPESIFENRDDHSDEVLSPSDASVEQNNDSNRQEKIQIVIENQPDNHDENSQENNFAVNDEENNSRSAEQDRPDKELSNEELSSEEENGDFSVEDYLDKKIDMEGRGRADTRKPERKEHFNARPMNPRQYGPPEDHMIIDPGPIRTFSEVVVPRYRPVLTRNGLVYTPSLFTMQTGSPLLDRLSGRNWVPNRPQLNQEAEVFSRQRNSRLIGLPQYEDSKMIDDYNDYGSNTYSYTPVRKITTQAPPQQILAPNKFDVFQKLVEASGHPKATKRTYNEFPVSYHPQRQYADNYATFDVRRIRRYAQNE